MSEISEERLEEMSALCDGVVAEMKGTPQNYMRELIAEIRRLRAENAEWRRLLQSAVDFADEAWAKWDADEDARVGKMLIALAGGVPKYRPETDAIHKALKS